MKHRVLVALLAMIAAPAVMHGQDVIEGFEAISDVKVEGGRLTLVKGAPFVTEGQTAARLPAGAKILVTLPADVLDRTEWLRLDTHSLGPLPHRLSIGLSAEDRERTVSAYVRPGKDTLAVPIPAFQPRGTTVKSRALTFELTNVGPTVITLDNLRLEPAAKAPDGAVLQDFGHADQAGWPGFDAIGGPGSELTWASRSTVRSYDARVPNPLTGDFLGPAMTDSAESKLNLGRASDSWAAWLWTTHYGPDYTLPVEYSVRFRNRLLAGKKLSRGKYFGAEGLLVGRDGLWTPAWFDEQFAPMLAEVVECGVTPRSRTLDLLNVQVAAMMLVPPAAKAQGEQYVRLVQADLSRFHRQFVLGSVRFTRCQIAPASPDDPLTVLAPPPDDWFAARYAPLEAHRARTVRASAANGGYVSAVLAVAPREATRTLRALTGAFRDESGRPLLVERPGLKVSLLERLPRVVGGAAQFEPWPLTDAHGPVEPGQIVFAVVHGQVKSTAGACVYKGTVNVIASSKRQVVPMEIEVFDLGADDVTGPVIASTQGGKASEFFRTAASAESAGRQRVMNDKVRRLLAGHGIEAFAVRGAYLDHRSKPRDHQCLADLKGYPTDRAKGPALLDVGDAASKFAVGHAGGVSQLETAATTAFGKTVQAAKTNGLKDCYLAWRIWRNANHHDLIAHRIFRAGGRPMIWLRTSQAAEFFGGDAYRALMPWEAILLDPDHTDTAACIEAFKKLKGTRQAYIQAQTPANRYACGFFAAVIGADGAYVNGLSFAAGEAYMGFFFRGQGLLTLQPNGELSPTLATIRLARARADYRLLKRCQGLIAEAAAAGKGAASLQAVVDEIRADAGQQRRIGLDWETLTPAVAESKLDTWRTKLLTEGAKLAAAVSK